MPLFSVMVFKANGHKVDPFILTQAHNVSSFSFWTRGTVKEFCRFGCRTVVARTNVGERQSVLQENTDAFEDSIVVHARVRPDMMAAAVVTDVNYPGRVAFNLLDKAMAEMEEALPEWDAAETDQSLTVEGVNEMLAMYDNPADADDLTRIQSDLDETRDVMLQNIETLLERGERIEDLVDKSNDLSMTSKKFSKSSAKLNKCSCILL